MTLAARPVEDVILELVRRKRQARALVETALATQLNDQELIAVMMTFAGHNGSEIARVITDRPLTRQRGNQLVHDALHKVLSRGQLGKRVSLRDVFQPREPGYVRVLADDWTLDDYAAARVDIDDITEMKACTACGRVLPATAEYFYRDATKTDGLRSRCKGCESSA